MRRTAKSTKQQQADFRAAGRGYAAMFDKPVRPEDQEPINLIAMRRKQLAVDERKAADAAIYKAMAKRTEPTEAQILTAIMKLLNHHPKVAKVWRQNSGTFALQYGQKTHYVRANTARGMSDIAGVLIGGRGLYIEVKSRTGRIAEHQQEFLDSMTAAGAVAFVARSVDDVINALK